MESIAKQLIPFAVRAPSGHNTQPWQFSVEQDTIRIYPDLSRRLPVVDPDDHALFISLGCALENLVVAAAQQGLAASIDYFPADEPEECLRVRLSEDAHEGEEALFRAIPERQSNRGTYDGRAIDDSDLARILEANPCCCYAWGSQRSGCRRLREGHLMRSCGILSPSLAESAQAVSPLRTTKVSPVGWGRHSGDSESVSFFPPRYGASP